MRVSLKIFFMLLAFSAVLSSCQKKAERIIEGGTWTVGLYMEDNKDETSDFNGYTFEFKKGGTFAATLPTSAIINGTWSYDNNSTKYKFSISGTDKLDKINDDWLIISKSSSLIELKNFNSSKNELLSFKKK
jgi:hypothetical protein